jgi:hypothetical protein
MDLDTARTPYTPTTGARRLVRTPVIDADEGTLRGFGLLVDAPHDFPIEIVRWPAQGWRPVDENSGDQGGLAEGVFEFWWRGDTLYARNSAVGDDYLFGWSRWPEAAAAEGPTAPREAVLIWRANYHPDGGQLFWPLAGHGFVIPLALPGDDVTPESFVSFRFDGGRGLYIHPGVWHGAVAPFDDHARFLDRQGRVHARISVDFAKEFGCYLEVPLARGASRPTAPAAA